MIKKNILFIVGLFVGIILSLLFFHIFYQNEKIISVNIGNEKKDIRIGSEPVLDNTSFYLEKNKNKLNENNIDSLLKYLYDTLLCKYVDRYIILNKSIDSLDVIVLYKKYDKKIIRIRIKNDKVLIYDTMIKP